MGFTHLSSVLISAVFLTAPAVGQTAPASTTASKTTSAHVIITTKTIKTNAPVQRSAKSLDCSKQADAKNVHGKARKTFMSSCKKA